MIEISVAWAVWILFGVNTWFVVFLVSLFAQFGSDGEKALKVSAAIATTCTVLYFLFTSGILKIVD